MVRRVILELKPAIASDVICYSPSAEGDVVRGGSASQWLESHPFVLPAEVDVSSCRCMGTVRQAFKDMPEVKSR